MNFGEEIKKEILSKNLKDKHCKKAFIAGLLRGSGTLYEKDGELGLEFKVADEETAMFGSLCLKSLFNYAFDTFFNITLKIINRNNYRY